MKKVTGIGGIFFKSAQPDKMNEWYATHLGVPISEHGTMFASRDMDDPEKVAYTIWSPFAHDTTYFEPSKKEFMINYRVEDLEALVDELKGAGVTFVDEIKTYDYGKFVHIMDPEGNNIELWEPIGE